MRIDQPAVGSTKACEALAEPSRDARPVPLSEAATRLREDAATWRAAARSLPVRWPAEYLELAASPEGEPIRRMGAPHRDELAPQPGELRDPVGESGLVPAPFVVRKHADRVILLVTSACHFYCRFCFRRSFPDGEHRGPSRGEMAAAIGALREMPDLREVILSGGDPLTLADERLAEILAECSDIPQVTRLRVHSRAPVHEPSRITSDLARAMNAACGGKPLRLVTHPNHAVELTPSLARAVATLQDAGIPVLSQSVLLRGVNDSPADLVALVRGLDPLGVTPHYLHHPDRVAGAARFFVSLRRGLEIVTEARASCALPPYVIDVPDGSGKVPVESLERVGELRYRAPSGFEWDDIRD